MGEKDTVYQIPFGLRDFEIHPGAFILHDAASIQGRAKNGPVNPQRYIPVESAGRMILIERLAIEYFADLFGFRLRKLRLHGGFSITEYQRHRFRFVHVNTVTGAKHNGNGKNDQT
ncbi:MAG: hypothetical protein IKT99_01325 [Oscillospiraceae bacterium]|nr:hypothetical protein [Oscillospiraceae bacterium]